jgi:hypothetical protein
MKNLLCKSFIAHTQFPSTGKWQQSSFSIETADRKSSLKGGFGRRDSIAVDWIWESCMSSMLVGALLLILSASASASTGPNVDPRVLGYIGLLVQSRNPTLADYSRFSGECGGEGELAFSLRECRSHDWTTESAHCLEFVHQHCRSESEKPSFVLDWLRTRFATAGKKFRIVHIDPKLGGTYQVLARIGKDDFTLFYDSNPYPPGGLVVDVARVNGRNINEYLSQEENVRDKVGRTSASTAQTPVASQGTTILTRAVGTLHVQVKIATHEVQIGKPGDPRPTVIDSSCTYSRFPCSIVDRIEIAVNQRPLYIPRSVYCDLADLNTVAISAGKAGAVLTLVGGDASEAYTAKIAFGAGHVTKRSLYSGMSPQQPLQETTYRVVVVGD